MTTKLDLLFDDLIEIDPIYESLDNIESKYECFVTFDVEKMNSLQLSYYYEFEFIDKILHVEVESGINRGTVIVDHSWESISEEMINKSDFVIDIEAEKEPWDNKNLPDGDINQEKDHIIKFIKRGNYNNHPIYKSVYLDINYESKNIKIIDFMKINKNLK